MTTTFTRRIHLVLGVLLLAAAVLATVLPSVPTTADTRTTADGFAPGCIGYCKRPTNAAKVFRWGLEEWRREFEDRSVSQAEGGWRASRPGLVEQREGMLTIHATATTPDLTVEATDQSAQYGRWEARVRVVEESTGDTPFTFVWELAPTSGDSCDPNRIVLASYRPGDARVKGEVRTPDEGVFRYSRGLDLRSRAWHTYAVEVTPKHISWFVDTQVIRTERRTAARTGAAFHPQFQILGQPGQRMNTSRLQMDWVRYYDLDRPNAKSITARRMTRGTLAASC